MCNISGKMFAVFVYLCERVEFHVYENDKSKQETVYEMFDVLVLVAIIYESQKLF